MMRGFEPGYRMMDFPGNFFIAVGCMLFFAGLIALIIYLIVKLTKQSSPINRTYPKINTALAILDERYAKGELTDEEYLTKKNNLKITS